ncbi:MAG TPA: tripartite tricarboxylate transporter substrate-binding protein, partial [Usitatibacter sp.]|nr:tripartite tricarboxylate transporter substrate-binding protein [Usitatibacter sp.]
MIRKFAAALAAFVLSLPAFAQEWPSRTITVIVPFAAGGPTDTVARLIGQSMTKTLGQTVIVENAGGAGGTIGVEKVAKAKPDGYTLLLMHIGISTSPSLYRNLRYDPVKELDPIGLITDVPMTIIAKKDFPP